MLRSCTSTLKKNWFPLVNLRLDRSEIWKENECELVHSARYSEDVVKMRAVLSDGDLSLLSEVAGSAAMNASAPVAQRRAAAERKSRSHGIESQA